ncbi:ribonuclease H [Microcoleus sp. MON1_C5]
MALVCIFCDGSCSGNPGPGGWAAVLTVPGRPNIKIVSGGVDQTTNNRMELTAAIEGLKALHSLCEVEIVSDSTYLCHTMTKNWKRRVNLDLWELLDSLCATYPVTWVWRPRNSTPELVTCDRVAKEQWNKQAVH